MFGRTRNPNGKFTSWENTHGEHSASKHISGDFDQSSTAGDSSDRYVSGSAHRADLSQTGAGSFLAHDQRMGHRASRLDYVSGVSHLGTELCGLVPGAEVAAAWNSWPYRTRHTLDLCDWRGWGRNIYDRSYAASLPAIHQRHRS